MAADTVMPVEGDNRVVRGLWIGGRLSELERLCIRSFCANGHEFHLYAYDELQNLPQAGGLRVLDGADILPRRAMFTYRRGGLSGFSNHFRWELLRREGGWWVDMDVVCLRALDFSDDAPVFGYDAPWSIATGIMKFPRGHFIAEAMAKACANVDRFMPWDTPRRKRDKIQRRLMFWRDSRKHQRFGEAGGPGGFELALKHFRMENYALPIHVFYPVVSQMLMYLFDDTLYKMGALTPMLSQAHTVHFWNNYLREYQINKDGKFPDNSPYEILKRRYPEKEGVL